MKLQPRTIKEISEMICGQDYGENLFPYRSSSYLTDFFSNCNLPHCHDGSTRNWWVRNVLDELNERPVDNPLLPSNELIAVITELLEPTEFQDGDDDRSKALSVINKSISRDGIEVYRDKNLRVYVRDSKTKSSTTEGVLRKRFLNDAEKEKKRMLANLLDEFSEDQFIEEILVPIMRQLGFNRVSATGHKDKSLEFGKDLWMKFRLPTSNELYFGMQVKKGKIDSAGKSNGNIAEILNQIHMALSNPVWDPENNKRHLLDHVFIVASGEITKQAKYFLAEKLDTDSRRQIMFMDRDDVLELALAVNFEHELLKTKPENGMNEEINPEDIPF